MSNNKLHRGRGYLSGTPIAGLGAIIPWFALSGPIEQEEELVLCATTYLLLIVILLVISIFIAVWVYRDAETRGMSGALWLIVVLVAGIIGLIIYLIVRTDSPRHPVTSYPPPPPPPRYEKYSPYERTYHDEVETYSYYEGDDTRPGYRKR